MPPDLWSFYTLMFRSRRFEQAITRLWQDGLISGEMHLGTGEEAIVAGVVSQLQPGDAMALDHRGTPPLVMRGVNLVSILRELLGCSGGLSNGWGGHMHLFSKEPLAASSGIVGAAGPAAAGFGLAAQTLRPGTLAVAFFGEGAMNQGMLMESLNLAAAWKLPVLFVCKDDSWAITTHSTEMTAGNLARRARGLGAACFEADGRDVLDVWQSANQAIRHARSGQGPAFLHARCVHLEAHFLGYPLLRAIRQPLQEIPTIAVPLLRSFLRPGGASLTERLAGLRLVLGLLLATLRDPRRQRSNDPVARLRQTLSIDSPRLAGLESDIEREITSAVSAAILERGA